MKPATILTIRTSLASSGVHTVFATAENLNDLKDFISLTDTDPSRRFDLGQDTQHP